MFTTAKVIRKLSSYSVILYVRMSNAAQLLLLLNYKYLWEKAKFFDHVLYYPERKLYPVPENRLVKYFAYRNMISARQYTSLNDYNTLTVAIAEYTLDHSSCYKNVFNGLNPWNANIDTK